MLENSNVIARFWSKVNKTDSCWLWTASTTNDGYGLFHLKDRMTRAHRFSLILNGVNIPIGAIVMHKCDNPSCVRPDHLNIGSHTDNMTDRQNKNRQAKGESSAKSTILEKQVIEIRNLYANTNITKKELAQKYNISLTHVCAIINRKYWKHI